MKKFTCYNSMCESVGKGSIMVWRFKQISSAGLRFHSHLSGSLRLRNYCAAAGNHKFSSWFSVFACFRAIIQTDLRD